MRAYSDASLKISSLLPSDEMYYYRTWQKELCNGWDFEKKKGDTSFLYKLFFISIAYKRYKYDLRKTNHLHIQAASTWSWDVNLLARVSRKKQG